MNRFALVLVLILSDLSGHAIAAADSERVRAAEQMLTELGFGEIYVAGTRKGLANEAREHPERSADLTWIGNQLTAAEAVERIAPIYAEGMTKVQADEVRIFFATPPGSKYWNGLKAEAVAGRKSFSSNLNWQEQQIVENFLKSNASWAAFNRAQNLGASAIRIAGQTWVRQIVERNVAALSRQLADALENGRTSSDPSGSNSLAPSSSTPAAGGAIGTELVAVIKDVQTRAAAIADRLSMRRAELKLPTVLSPANLLSKDSIEDGRRRLDLYETALSTNQRESDQLDDELMQRLRELPGPKGTRDLIVQGAEKSATATYERSLRWQENQRRSLNITRQILNFSEQRLGQVRSEDDKLIFKDIDDLHTYEALVQQLRIEAQAETEILREQQAAQDDAVRALRSAGSKIAPVTQPPVAVKALAPELTAKMVNDVWLAPPKGDVAEVRSPCNSEPVAKGVPYAMALRTAVERCFITPPNLAEGARCELEIRQTETGKVTSAKVGSCQGHPLLGDFLTRAALKASPLPLPADPKNFMPVVRLVFNLNGTTNNAAAELSSATEIKQLEQRIAQLEAENAEAMQKEMQRRRAKTATGGAPKPLAESRSATTDAAKRLASLEATIDKRIEEYGVAKRKRFIGARTDEYRYAKYVEDWRRKVEQAAIANYPTEARGRLYGTLVLTVTIAPDGSLSAPPTIDRSSGHKVLDDAAVRIVQLASPFDSFPPDVRQETDLLVITRTFSFTRDDAISP